MRYIFYYNQIQLYTWVCVVLKVCATVHADAILIVQYMVTRCQRCKKIIIDMDDLKPIIVCSESMTIQHTKYVTEDSIFCGHRWV